MKRASLSVRPPAPKAESADLTDRLLDREANADRAQPTGSAPPPRARTRRPPAARPPPEPEAQPPVLVASTTDDYASLDAAVAQAMAAADALETAARQSPARYEVALRYRLDALAHHLRQVAEFVANVARR